MTGQSVGHHSCKTDFFTGLKYEQAKIPAGVTPHCISASLLAIFALCSINISLHLVKRLLFLNLVIHVRLEVSLTRVGIFV